MKKPIKKFPRLNKYSTHFKYKIKQKYTETQKAQLLFGACGFRALNKFRVTFREIEAVRKTIAFNNKSTKIWFRVEFNIPLTFKPSSSRMGKGKGKISCWTSNVEKGAIFIEFDSYKCKYQVAKINRLIQLKLSIKTKLVVCSLNPNGS